MLLKTLQLTARNFRNVTRLVAAESCVYVPVQSYARFAPRQGKIVNEDELFDVELPTPTPPTVKEFKPKFPKSKAKDTQDCNNEMGKVFKKVQENEKLMSSIMLSLKSKKARKKNDEILLEGVRLIEDAIKAGVVLETLIFSQLDDIKDLDVPSKAKLYKVSYRSIQLWSTLTTAPGVMGIFQKPKPLKPSKDSLPITIICDNVRDPGNMGSVLRAAAGAGVEKVILTKGCVDFWDPKVLRSAAGAHFRISVYSSMEWEDIHPLLNQDAQVYVADNHATILTEEYDESVTKTEEEEEEEEDDSNEFLEKAKKKTKLKLKRLQMGGKDWLSALNNTIPLAPYYAVDYAKHHTILIVGGETEGVSAESYKLVKDRQGLRVNIPLGNGVESLNAGMALGIIAFEMKRQFLKVKNKLHSAQAQ